MSNSNYFCPCPTGGVALANCLPWHILNSSVRLSYIFFKITRVVILDPPNKDQHEFAFTGASAGLSGALVDVLAFGALGVYRKHNPGCNGCFGILYSAEVPQFVLTALSDCIDLDGVEGAKRAYQSWEVFLR